MWILHVCLFLSEVKCSFRQVHFDWPIVHFRKICEAQLIRGCFSFSQPLRAGVFFRFSPPPPHLLCSRQYGGELTTASSNTKTPALQANFWLSQCATNKLDYFSIRSVISHRVRLSLICTAPQMIPVPQRTANDPKTGNDSCKWCRKKSRMAWTP